MEEQGAEWKSREYPSDEGRGGKVNWIWNKGLGLGKKILVGGAVVSSAPLFLPPLLVISVLGVAVSVPYGILLGSYACTEKLMSKLLPPPTRPLSGYGTISFDDDEEDVDYGGAIDMENEEKELMEDVKAGVETRIELVDKDHEELEGDKGKVPEEYGHEQLGSFSGAELGPEENAYEEHMGEYFDEEENMLLEVIETFEGMREGDVEEFLTEIREVEGIVVAIEGNGLLGSKVEEVVTPCQATSILEDRPTNEVEGVEIVIEGEELEQSNGEEAEIPRQVTTILVEECRNQERTSDIEEDELVRGTRGLLEKIRDEGRDDTGEELHGGAGVVDQDTYRSIEEMETPIEAKGAYINSNDRMKQPTTEIEEMSDNEVLGGHEEKREPRYMDTVKTAREEVNPTEEMGGKIIGEESKPIVNREMGEDRDETRLEEMHGGAEAVDQKIQRTIAEMETPIEAKRAYNTNEVMMDKPTREIEERSPVDVLVENEETIYLETVETVRQEVNPTEEMGGDIIEEESKPIGNREIGEDRDDNRLEEMHGGAEADDQKTQRTIEEMETPIEAKSAYNTNQVMMDKSTREIEERSPVEVLVKNEETKEASCVETVETVRVEVNQTEVMGLSVVQEEAKLMLKEEITLKGGGADSDAAKDETENTQLKGKSTIVYSNADARDIADDRGVDLFDDKNAAGQEYNCSDYETPEESEHSSWDMRSCSGNSLEPPASTRVLEAESKSQIGFRKDMNHSSNEMPYNEEKIWEQIHAMRTIVGYKAATHTTCIEELKALYMFTGIEPPASFHDSLDLVEVNEKLQFLMSIIGVK